MNNAQTSQHRSPVSPARLFNSPLFWAVLVFAAALGPRLYALGTFLTIDEVKWAEGAAQFLLALHSGDLFQTYWHFFPGITVTWGSALALGGLCAPAPDLAACATARVTNLAGSIGWLRLSPVLLTSLGVAGAYALGRKLLGHRIALTAALLLAFDPFFIAHSRILNGDAVAAILMFLSLLAFLVYWLGETGHLSWLLLSGALAGLSMLTKLPAPLIVVFMGGLGLAAVTANLPPLPKLGAPAKPQNAVRRWAVALILWGSVALLVFVALWPAMWVAPFDALRQMYVDTFQVGGAGEGHAAFFLGQTVSDPGPWFYPYAIAFRLTPVVMVGLLLGIIFCLLLLVNRHLSDTSRRSGFALLKPLRSTSSLLLPVALIASAYIIAIILFSTISPKKLDRYVMAVVPAIVLLASVGFDSALRIAFSLWLESGETVSGAAKSRRVYAPAVAGIVVLQALMAIFASPYYLTYYNPWLGGIERAASRVPVGWGEGLEQAAFYLNSLPKADALSVSSWYGDIFQPYFDGQRASFSDDGRAQLAADYVVFYVNQIQRQKPYAGLVDYFRSAEPVFTVGVKPTGRAVNLPGEQQGAGDPVPWVEVYKAPAAQSAGGAPKIEGVAQLLAYKVAGSKVAGSRYEGTAGWQLTADEVAVTLFLRVLGPLPEGTAINAALSGNGRWGGWASTEVKGEWSEGQIVEWRGRLVLPPEMPPGAYRLWAALQFKEGPVIAEFSVSEKDPAIIVE